MSILKMLINTIKRKKELEHNKLHNANNKSYLGNQTVEFVKIANKARNQTSESAIFQQLQNFARHCSFIESVQAGGANMATIILKTNTTNN